MLELNDFPDPRTADDEGLVAIGGDLTPDRLLKAYQSGIFPWFKEDGIIYWFCPVQRMILFPEEVKVSRSMMQVLNSGKFRITVNHAFEAVITGCASFHKETNERTWIDPSFIEAYTLMHQLGHAHSVEVWTGKELAGGLYGMCVGNMFCGESMFSRVSNASKAALIHLCRSRKYSLIDCQVPTEHLMSMGARLIHRSQFLKLLAQHGHQDV